MRMSIKEALERGVLKPSQAAKMRSDAAKKEKRRQGVTGKKGKSNRDIEGLEQAELVSWFNETFDEYAGLLIHIPMGGSRANKFEGWRLKQQGARKGVSDLECVVKRHGYGALWIEFKAEPPNDAQVTRDQRDWIKEIIAQGHAGCVVRGVEAAKQVIDAYMVGTKSNFINAVHEADRLAALPKNIEEEGTCND